MRATDRHGADQGGQPDAHESPSECRARAQRKSVRGVQDDEHDRRGAHAGDGEPGLAAEESREQEVVERGAAAHEPDDGHRPATSGDRQDHDYEQERQPQERDGAAYRTEGVGGRLTVLARHPEHLDVVTPAEPRGGDLGRDVHGCAVVLAGALENADVHGVASSGRVPTRLVRRAVRAHGEYVGIRRRHAGSGVRRLARTSATAPRSGQRATTPTTVASPAMARATRSTIRTCPPIATGLPGSARWE